MTTEGRPDRQKRVLRPRERVLATAIRLFLEEGIRAVGVHRIVGFTSRQELRRALEERSDGRLHLDPENA